MEVGFLLPGLYIQGTVRVPPSMVNHFDPGYFSRFFAVTEATLTEIDGRQRHEDVIIVHRDHVSAYSQSSH